MKFFRSAFFFSFTKDVKSSPRSHRDVHPRLSLNKTKNLSPCSEIITLTNEQAPWSKKSSPKAVLHMNSHSWQTSSKAGGVWKIPFQLKGKFSEKLISIWMEAHRRSTTRWYMNFVMFFCTPLRFVLFFSLIQSWKEGFRWTRLCDSLRISFHEHSPIFPYQYYNCIPLKLFILS